MRLRLASIVAQIPMLKCFPAFSTHLQAAHVVRAMLNAACRCARIAAILNHGKFPLCMILHLFLLSPCGPFVPLNKLSMFSVQVKELHILRAVL
jgi:hypothetical protein